MNITSTVSRRIQTPSSRQSRESQQQQPPQSGDGFTYSDGVRSAASYTAGIAGGLKGVGLGWTKGIDLAAALGIQEAGPLMLGTMAIGGTIGALAGFHGSKFAGEMAGKAANAMGISENAGQIVGAVAVGGAFGGVFTGNVTGAVVGAGISLGAGGLVYASNRS